MEKEFINYCNHLLGESLLRTKEDFIALSSAKLLQLAHALPDELLPFLMGVFKESKGGDKLFVKLMGSHDAENRFLVDSFFERYMNLVLEDELLEYNPLVIYLDSQLFTDLALVQTRESFFKRQTISCINEFLQLHFNLEEDFLPGEEQKAWNFFFSQLLSL
ncbi:MAG: hypothetical protein GX801_07425 [Fibrobacter sp.]|nr:hypothetical protein [Fibrobacter sp.]